jgi:chaperonin cofactor prefoldin
MVQLSKLHEEEPEIREDLQGRIEVFDQSIRSFEKRLRAVERRLSLETPPAPQAGIAFSGNFSDPFPEESAGGTIAAASVFPHIPSIYPESSIPLHGNSLLSDSVSSFSEGNIQSPALSSTLAPSDVPKVSMTSMDSSSEVSGNAYKIKTINDLFSSLSESIRSIHTSVSELSSLVHNNLKPEMERLDMEIQNLRAQEVTESEYIKRLESRVEVLENQNKLTFGSIKIPLEISGIAGSSILFLTGFLVWSGRWDILRSPYFSTGLAMLMAGVVFMKFYMVNRKKKSLTD